MKVIDLFKKQPVLTVALIAAAVTCFFVPPDTQYLGYFDFKTLACLFCTLAAVGGFARIHTFRILSRKIVRRLSNTRNVITAIVFITYFGSMLLANDMALLTFLPLGYFSLSSANMKKYMAYTFVMQNIAANLGGMLTPFGNPQNLYLYSYFSIDTAEFFSIMFPPFAAALVLILICCAVIPKEEMRLSDDTDYHTSVPKTVIYSVLFVLSILMVMRVIPYVITTIIVTVCIIIVDRKVLLEVNYPLLLTFAAFFVFSGNMARIDAVSETLSALIAGRTLLVGTATCQFISNVPSAVMLSHFTNDYANLLIAVNIGGLGTPIASLASLITLTEYRLHDPKNVKKYIILFEIVNFSFLAVLFAVSALPK